MADQRCENAATCVIGAWTRGAPFEACCAHVQDAINDALAAASGRIAELKAENQALKAVGVAQAKRIDELEAALIERENLASAVKDYLDYLDGKVSEPFGGEMRRQAMRQAVAAVLAAKGGSDGT